MPCGPPGLQRFDGLRRGFGFAVSGSRAALEMRRDRDQDALASREDPPYDIDGMVKASQRDQFGDAAHHHEDPHRDGERQSGGQQLYPKLSRTAMPVSTRARSGS